MQQQQSTQEGIVPLLLQKGRLVIRFRWSRCRAQSTDTPKASIISLTPSLRANTINLD